MDHFQFSKVLFFCFLLTLPPPSIRAASIRRSNVDFNHVADLLHKGVIALDKYVMDMIDFKQKHQGNLHADRADTHYSRIVNDAKKVHERMDQAKNYLHTQQNKVMGNIQALQNEEKQIQDYIRSKQLEEERSKNKIKAETAKVKTYEDRIDQIEDSIARDKRKIQEIKDQGVQCEYGQLATFGTSVAASFLCGLFECSDETNDRIQGGISSVNEKLQKRCKEVQESKSEWENKLETEIRNRRQQERKRNAEQNILNNVQQELQYQKQQEKVLNDHLAKDRELERSMADLWERISDVLVKSTELFIDGEEIYKQTKNDDNRFYATHYNTLDSLVTPVQNIIENLMTAASGQNQVNSIFSQRARQVSATCEKLKEDIKQFKDTCEYC